MFAFVIPGRPVQQALLVPGAPDRFAAIIDNALSLNHLTVFLDGSAPFPEGYGCTIHLDVPGKGWSLIGGLANNKPSAIFRLRGTLIPSSTSFSATSSDIPSTSATLGILCEPLTSVEAQLSALPSSSSSSSNPADSAAGALVVAKKDAGLTADPVVVAQRVGLNLMNHLAGFAQSLPDGSGQWVDMRAVENWWKTFERKITLGGVGFLLND